MNVTRDTICFDVYKRVHERFKMNSLPERCFEREDVFKVGYNQVDIEKASVRIEVSTNSLYNDEHCWGVKV